MEVKTLRKRKEKKKVIEVIDSSEECYLEKTLTNIEREVVRYLSCYSEVELIVSIFLG